MRLKFIEFCKTSLKNYSEAIVNLFIFIPYFFSVSTLLKTLFFPWKNIVTKKETVGFSFGEFAERAGFNILSRVIGLFMRFSIITFYLLFQIFFVILLPFITALFIVILPVLYINYLFQETEDQKKTILKKAFMDSHLLKQENLTIVNQWFEWYYKQYLHRSSWWKLNNLLSYPPLARDWAAGYTPTLDKFCEELTSTQYQHSRARNIVNRKREIQDMEQILTKNEQANVLIVGEEGVGKHTIVDALAKKIYEGKTTTSLAYKRLLKLNMEKILNTYTDQKQRENFIEDLFNEAGQAKNVILMIENIDKYVDFALSIEKFGKNNIVQFIGTTTPFFYQKFIFQNEKINRIFSKIDVCEITEKEAEVILLEAVPIFEKRNKVIIPYETIKNTIDKSEFYITHIPFPEKAIDLLDNACSYCKLNNKGKTSALLLPDIIDVVLSEKTHIPTKLTEEIRKKLIDLEILLNNRVLSQDQAIGKLSAAMRRSFILLGKRKKPLASFLFLGPTGVGKTETAKALSEIFFGSEKYLVRFDMSLYQTKEEIPHLVGSLDTGNPGLLTKAIRENPYSVLLLDELEKADKNLLNIFLTLIDEGYITDGFGKRVDCKNLIVIATSNAASSTDLTDLTDSTDSTNYLISHNIFSPEFLNRFDGVIAYSTLSPQTTYDLTKKMIDKIASNLYKMYRIKISVSDLTIKDLADKGYKPEFGARNLERTITQELEDKIAKLILEKKVTEGDTIQL